MQICIQTSRQVQQVVSGPQEKFADWVLYQDQHPQLIQECLCLYAIKWSTNSSHPTETKLNMICVIET